MRREDEDEEIKNERKKRKRGGVEWKNERIKEEMERAWEGKRKKNKKRKKENNK